MNNSLKGSTRITTLIIIFPLVALLLYGGLTYLFFFYTKQTDVKHELERYEVILMDTEKRSLTEKVENLTRFIRYYNYRSSDKIKKEIKNIIYASVDIVNNLYDEYKNIMDDAALKRLIIRALKGVSFEGETGYLFMLDTEGKVLIHADKALIGKNVLSIKDINGKYFVKEFMGVLDEYGEGYVDYYWYHSRNYDEGTRYKISFVKNLKMYGWYIGAGEFLEDTRSHTSNEILSYVKDNAYFEDGHFFLSNSSNVMVFHPDETQDEELNKYRIEGIYQDHENIAYTAYVAEYDWYVTAVKSLQAVRKKIESLKKKNERKIQKEISTNFYLLIATWTLSLLLSLYLSFMVNRMLKKYEQRLSESNDKLIFQSRQALIGELFSMIAHQWRQPINKIASILALLRFGTPEGKLDYLSLDKRFQEMEESIEFMSDTIDDFRTFYQPKEASLEMNLRILILKSIDFLSGNIHKKDIDVKVELEDITLRMYGNEFLQVMINLIKNSTDSVGMRGRILVKLEDRGKEIFVSVEDNGGGIEPDNLSRIFDPYFSTKSDSMGLGLYMSRMIVERHLGGEIRVESLPEGVKFVIGFQRQR